jgi:hypothetical protein
MASTYSTNLKIELMALGDQAGTWGTTTNTNLGTALEQAIVGYGDPVTPIFSTDADTTITLTNSNTSQTARNFALNVTSSVSLTATRNLIVPTLEKSYLIRNNTTGSQSIVVKTSAGTGVTVPNGTYLLVYVDGTNVVPQISQLPVLYGGTGQTTYTNGQLLIGNTTGSTLTKATLTAGTGITITNGSGAITIAGNTGTVTSVSGTGTVNGITLTGTVTTTGSLTLGGTLSGVSLTTQVTGTLPVANGGTGAAALTANNVLLGNGTSAVQFVAPGASGNVLTSNGTTWSSAAIIPSGTVMLFVQTSAPTGWTKSVAYNDRALRVVSGTAGTGGSVAFTTAFASQGVSGTVGNHTLTTAEIPSHTHTVDAYFNDPCGSPGYINDVSSNGFVSSTSSTSATGSGGAHNHSFSGTAINLAVQYVDVIIATKS